MSEVRVALQTDVVKVTARTSNIVGYLEGNDPAMKDQVVVLGAHMDHLGYGGPGSMTPDTVAIHHGADDNASGTAGLLEIAERLSAMKGELKRTQVFAFFSAEELGTLGSGYYVNHPPFPLSQTIAMLNMDMIGRLEKKTLTVGGTGTSVEWNQLLSRENRDSTFILKMNPEGFGPSDHSSFYAKDIPVLFFFTGIHDDYHKPSDQWQKLNYAGEEQVVRYVFRIDRDLDSDSAKPTLVHVQSAGSRSANEGDSRGFAVTLGIVPDFGESTDGMKISGVRPSGPAAKAGLKSGDVIVKMGAKKILNIYDYMGILGELKAGDEVEVGVLRDGKPFTVRAKMEKRK
jgi:hypothetical protein